MDFTKLLEVKDLNVSFKIDAGRVLAVNGVSLSLDKGKVLGIVGESGSGKSVTAYSIMGILDKNGRVDSGKINYKGTDLLRLNEKERRSIRGNKISIIFQDAMVSMNPVYTIGNQLREAVLVHAKDPIKVATSSIENDIKSDAQRIASLKKGISNHPEREYLKTDLKAVEKKYIEDKAKYEKIRKEAIETLKKNEAKKQAEYKSKLPVLNKNIKDSKKDVFKCLFKRGEKVSVEKARLDKITESHRDQIKDYQRRYKQRKAEYEKFKKTKNKSNDEFYAKEKKFYKKAFYHLRRHIGFEKAKVNALAHSVRLRAHFRPTIDAYKVYKATKFTKHEYYWECKSTFRETKWSANKKALAIMKDVGITDPQKRIKQYPFEFSGGMLQRCMIAMALVQKPDILIADEPTTALDVTIQAQILELLKKLQKEYGMAIIIITHDLGVVAQICDEVAIMYAGRIVERGNVREIFYNPQHEYTKGLLKSMPQLNSKKGKLESIPGNPVDLFCLPKGCAFCSRCSECMDICIDKYPEEVEYKKDHKASCWKMIKRLYDEGKIDIVNATPEGKPLIYNGAIIAEERSKHHHKHAKEVK